MKWFDELENSQPKVFEQSCDGNWDVGICQCKSVYDNLNDLNNHLLRKVQRNVIISGIPIAKTTQTLL